MRKNKKYQKTKNRSLQIIYKLIVLIALSTSTTFIVWFFGNAIGPGGSYQAIIATLIAILYLLQLVSSVLVICDKAKSVLLKRSVMIVTVAILAALAITIFGLLQDLAGMKCYDFLSWNSGSCLGAMQTRLYIIFISPFVFFPVILGMITLLALGHLKAYQVYTKSKRG